MSLKFQQDLEQTLKPMGIKVKRWASSRKSIICYFDDCQGRERFFVFSSSPRNIKLVKAASRTICKIYNRQIRTPDDEPEAPEPIIDAPAAGLATTTVTKLRERYRQTPVPPREVRITGWTKRNKETPAAAASVAVVETPDVSTGGSEVVLNGAAKPALEVNSPSETSTPSLRRRRKLEPAEEWQLGKWIEQHWAEIEEAHTSPEEVARWAARDLGFNVIASQVVWTSEKAQGRTWPEIIIRSIRKTGTHPSRKIAAASLVIGEAVAELYRELGKPLPANFSEAMNCLALNSHKPYRSREVGTQPPQPTATSGS